MEGEGASEVGGGVVMCTGSQAAAEAASAFGELTSGDAGGSGNGNNGGVPGSGGRGCRCGDAARGAALGWFAASQPLSRQ